MGQGATGAASGAMSGAALGPIGAIGGAALGFIGGEKASEQAQAMEDQQAAALKADQQARQTYLAQQQNAFGPIQQQLTQEAASPLPLNYGAMSGQINQNYDTAQRNAAAQMASRGMSGSGLQGGQIQGLEMGRAGALAGAFQNGLQARQQLGMNLLQHYNPLGNAQFGAGALGAQMQEGQYQQTAATTAANNAYGALGKGLGSLGTWAGQPGQPQVPGQSPGMGNYQGLAGMNNQGLDAGGFSNYAGNVGSTYGSTLGNMNPYGSVMAGAPGATDMGGFSAYAGNIGAGGGLNMGYPGMGMGASGIGSPMDMGGASAQLPGLGGLGNGFGNFASGGWPGLGG